MLLGAPVSAKLVQSYLDITGDFTDTLFLIVFLAPLYGGAALLVREVAVRAGRGWPGMLLLSWAFGVAMPGLVDLSLFTEHNPDVTGWDDHGHRRRPSNQLGTRPSPGRPPMS